MNDDIEQVLKEVQRIGRLMKPKEYIYFLESIEDEVMILRQAFEQSLHEDARLKTERDETGKDLD